MIEVPSPVSPEILHEERMLVSGIERYQNKAAKAKVKGHEDETDYGQHITKVLIGPLAEALKSFVAAAKAKPGRRALAAVVLQRVDPHVAAFIAAREAIQNLSSPEPIQALAAWIGEEIEDEIRLGEFESQQPEHFKGTKRFISEGGHSWDRNKRRAVLMHAAKVHEVKWRPWSRKDRVHVGAAMLDLMLGVAGDLFDLVQAPRGRRKSGQMYTILATPQLMEWALKIQGEGALLRPKFLPTIEPPIDWMTLRGGGYHHPRLKRRLIRGRLSPEFVRELAAADMPMVYRATNVAQATKWTVDPFVLETADQAAELKLQIKGLPVPIDVESAAPPRPRGYNAGAKRGHAWDRVHPDHKREWKRTVRKLYHANKKTTSRMFSTATLLSSAKHMLKHREIYFPTTLDFRGRMYPIAPGLNPQGSDLSKALLRFAESKPLGERGAWWLAIHVANNFGIDKVDLEQRVAWTHENSARITAVAADPFADLWWTEADKPWQFLQAAMEWKGFVDEGPSFESSLPITIDGSCNGIQHLAAMSLDAEAGRRVNLLPGDKPADIYQAVADDLLLAIGQSDVGNNDLGLPSKKKPKKPAEGAALWTNHQWAHAWLGFGIDRKLTKRPTMVQPYGGTLASCQDYIQVRLDELAEEGKVGPWGDRTALAARWLSGRLWAAMARVITGPRVTMDWLQLLAKVASSYGQPTTWVLPTGFICQQKYTETDSSRIETKIGDSILQLTVANSTDRGLDKRRQRSSISPNFIHSYDASALMLTICALADHGVTSITSNHDCYGTLAADMDLLARLTREQFVATYKDTDVLGRLRDQVLRQLPAKAAEEIPLPPPRGTLDISKVLISPFFFA